MNSSGFSDGCANLTSAIISDEVRTVCRREDRPVFRIKRCQFRGHLGTVDTSNSSCLTLNDLTRMTWAELPAADLTFSDCIRSFMSATETWGHVLSVENNQEALIFINRRPQPSPPSICYLKSAVWCASVGAPGSSEAASHLDEFVVRVCDFQFMSPHFPSLLCRVFISCLQLEEIIETEHSE